MISRFDYFFIFSLFILFSCNHSSSQQSAVSPDSVLKDFRSWWNYNYENINLSEDYRALDTSSQVIGRELFLKSLGSGEFVAIRIRSDNSKVEYKLFKLGPLIDREIKTEAKRFGEDGLKKYRMEGTEIPDFHFIDLHGNIYNKETTKGKIVVLKCWFIHCQACVEEIPALNEVVRKYQNRKDILFISLAYDSKEELIQFLTRTKFDYAVIPVQQKYMEEQLKITEYPTQFIVSKTGYISKVVTNYHEMISSLKSELLK